MISIFATRNFQNFTMKKVFLLATLVTLISCAENVPPTCVITSPALDEVFLPTEMIPITVDAMDSDGSIREVRILVDDIEVAILEDQPFVYNLDIKDYEIGAHQVEAIAIDNNRAETSDDISFIIGSIPLVGTGPASTVGVDSAIVGVTIFSGSSPLEAGIYWGPDANTETTGTQVKFSTVPGSFSMLIRNLVPGTKYYYRAFAENDFGISYGDELSFKTLVMNLPEVSTVPASEIQYTSAMSGGTILSDGQGSILEKGVCWSTESNPTINDDRTNDGTGKDAYYSQLTQLTASTTYYIRAYATNELGTGYGNEETFITADYTTPQLSTRDITDVTQTSATSGGYITKNGGQEVSERGICLSTSPGPTVEDQKISHESGGSGNFVSTITNLEPGTVYYIRAFAINSIGPGYGNELFFSTIGTPTVVSSIPFNITSTGATVGGDIIADGGAEIIRKGVYVGLTGDPVTTGNNYILGSGMGEFQTNLESLSSGETYYIVAYAANSYGTAYGEVLEFSTQ